MASFYAVLNTTIAVNGQAHRILAGSIISDPDVLLAMQHNGIPLIDARDTTAQMHAAQVVKARYRGQNEEVCQAIMMQAMNAQANQSDFGSGQDGAIVLDGNAQFSSFSTLANGIYTLTRDVFFASLLVMPLINLDTAGFRVYCIGILDNDGIIQNDGNNAVGATPGAATPTTGTIGSGVAGGAGRSNNNGFPGTAQTNTVTDANLVGGKGGDAGVNTGGAGGTYATAPANDGGSNFTIPIITGSIIGQQGSNTRWQQVGGGAGGGGGASDSLNATSGAGGGGGGVVGIYAYSIVNDGIISARGGNGGNATGTGGNAGGGGGGAGGIILTLSRLSGGAGLWLVSGGLGGFGFGAGLQGSPGSIGHMNSLQG